MNIANHSWQGGALSSTFSLVEFASSPRVVIYVASIVNPVLRRAKSGRSSDSSQQ